MYWYCCFTLPLNCLYWMQALSTVFVYRYSVFSMESQSAVRGDRVVLAVTSPRFLNTKSVLVASWSNYQTWCLSNIVMNSAHPYVAFVASHFFVPLVTRAPNLSPFTHQTPRLGTTSLGINLLSATVQVKCRSWETLGINYFRGMSKVKLWCIKLLYTHMDADLDTYVGT